MVERLPIDRTSFCLANSRSFASTCLNSVVPEVVKLLIISIIDWGMLDNTVDPFSLMLLRSGR